jgi:hypothetical protein
MGEAIGQAIKVNQSLPTDQPTEYKYNRRKYEKTIISSRGYISDIIR